MDKEKDLHEEIGAETSYNPGGFTDPEVTADADTTTNVGETADADVTTSADTAASEETAADPWPAADTETTANTSAANTSAAAEVPVQKKKSFLRASGSWTDIIPIAAMLSVILTFIGAAISAILMNTVLPVRQLGLSLFHDEGTVAFLLDYFSFFGIWLLFMVVITVFKDNRPMWKAFWYNRHGNNWKAVLIGILLGFGMNGSCIFLSWLQGDIHLYFNEFNPLLFFAFLFCVMIQSGAEEIVDRCYLYQKLRRRYRWPVIAVLFNALVFMSLHLANPGVTQLGLLQVFLIGVLFSLIVYFWDSLWTVIWAHTAWNFSQSIVFGLPNRGIVSLYSVFKLEAASARDGIFYNTSFGVEGSLGANVMIGVLIVVILIYGLATKRGEKRDYWQELEAVSDDRKHIWEAVVLSIIMVAILASVVLGSWWYGNHQDEIQQMIIEQIEEQEQTEGQEQTAEPASEPAPAQETEGQEQTAPAQQTEGQEQTAPAQQTGEQEQTAPAQQTGEQEQTAPAQQTEGQEQTAPAPTK